jgi:hypothetical protein
MAPIRSSSGARRCDVREEEDDDEDDEKSAEEVVDEPEQNSAGAAAEVCSVVVDGETEVEEPHAK